MGGKDYGTALSVCIRVFIFLTKDEDGAGNIQDESGASCHATKESTQKQTKKIRP